VVLSSKEEMPAQRMKVKNIAAALFLLFLGERNQAAS